MTEPLFILASASPRRLALLKDIGITPDKVIPADIDESHTRKERPRQAAARLAREKLNAVAVKNPKDFILSADTIVACGRRILPKAETARDVHSCLQLLSGRRHHVYTAIALRTPDGKIRERLAESTVIFTSLSSKDIDDYSQCGEGIGKAGGYAIQGKAAAYIRFISGSYSNIVGLPLFEVVQLLQGSAWAVRSNLYDTGVRR
jgi:septum formation protein